MLPCWPSFCLCKTQPICGFHTSGPYRRLADLEVCWEWRCTADVPPLASQHASVCNTDRSLDVGLKPKSLLSGWVGPWSPQLLPRFNSWNISASSRTLLPVLCLYRSLVLSFPNNIVYSWSLPDPGKLKQLCQQQGIKFSFFIRGLKHFKKKTTTQPSGGNILGNWCFSCAGQTQAFPFNNWNAIRKIHLWLIQALLWCSVSRGLGKETAPHQLAGLWWMYNLQLLSGCFLVFS